MLNIRDLSRPELPNQDNYQQALRIGLDAFAHKEPSEVALKAGGRFENRCIILPHLNRSVVLNVNSQQFTIDRTSEEAPIWLAILAIHYLNNAYGGQPTGKLKHFREFKEGHFYEPAFNRRTKEILVQTFGDDPASMIAAAEELNGKIVQSGDASAELSYFPSLPITCIVWKGDEEFAPEAAVLFDETADRYFSAEDMAVAGQMAVLELLKAART
jgi:hypothetical protein